MRTTLEGWLRGRRPLGAVALFAALGAAMFAVAFVQLRAAKAKADAMEREIRGVQSSLAEAETELGQVRRTLNLGQEEGKGAPGGGPAGSAGGGSSGDRASSSPAEDSARCAAFPVRDRPQYERCSAACPPGPGRRTCQDACDGERLRAFRDQCFASRGCASFLATTCEAWDYCTSTHDHAFCKEDAALATAAGCWVDLAQTCVTSPSWPREACDHLAVRNAFDFKNCLDVCDGDASVININDLGCRTRCAYWWGHAADTGCVDRHLACDWTKVNSCDDLARCGEHGTALCDVYADLSHRMKCWQGAESCGSPSSPAR